MDLKEKQLSERAPLCPDTLPSQPHIFLFLPADEAAGQDDNSRRRHTAHLCFLQGEEERRRGGRVTRAGLLRDIWRRNSAALSAPPPPFSEEQRWRNQNSPLQATVWRCRPTRVMSGPSQARGSERSARDALKSQLTERKNKSYRLLMKVKEQHEGVHSTYFLHQCFS